MRFWVSGIHANLPNIAMHSLKRKRIIDRLTRGSPNKKRGFAYSRLNDALSTDNLVSIEEQINILKAKVAVSCLKRRSVQMVRRLSEKAQSYLENSCGYSREGVLNIVEDMKLLID